MPRLLVFVACEKAMVDEDGNVSLIILLNNLNVQKIEGVEIPRSAVAPREWAIFSYWEPGPNDKDIEFTQKTNIAWPSGEIFQKSEMKFTFTEGKFHHVRQRIIGFPIGQDGYVTIQLHLESRLGKISEAATYKIRVQHLSGVGGDATTSAPKGR